MLVKTEAIVLHSLRIGDNRLIVNLLTKEQGAVQVALSLPKTQRGRLKKQFFQPLMALHVDIDMRHKAQLQHIRDASMLLPLPTLHTDPGKLAIVLFLAEFLTHALREEQRNVALFDYILSSLQWLEGCGKGYANFHLVVLRHLAQFLGIEPYLGQYGEGDVFDMRSATFSQLQPTHRDFLTPGETATLRTLMRIDFSNMHLFRMSREERNQCLEAMLKYYRLHLPAMPELKSVEVLQQLFV